MGQRDRDVQGACVPAPGGDVQLVRKHFVLFARWAGSIDGACHLCSGRLAEIMRHQASLLELIVTEQRYYPDYFRVAFYGNFPTALRNKQFIVRPYDRNTSGHLADL